MFLEPARPAQGAQALIAELLHQPVHPKHHRRFVWRNVQRAVLARELGCRTAKVLIMPTHASGWTCRRRIHPWPDYRSANRGVAVLLVSEDLDELMAWPIASL